MVVPDERGPMDTVSEQRLREDLTANAEFGAVDVEEGRGRTVLAGTDANRRAREYLRDRMEAAGLEVRIDGVGNVVARWTPASADPDAAPVASGSHLDSVPEGGIFDGPLGVYAALEAVRAMQTADVEPERPVEVVSFTEEEGARFGPGLLGSSVAAGIRDVEEALACRDADGTTLREGLASTGFLGEGRLDAAAWDAWLEVHVEQGTRLETTGVPAGVVRTVTGIAHYEAVVEGAADHAGTTPMDERRDALAAAAEIVSDMERAATDFAASERPAAVATVGSLDVAPNATNVVPGHVALGVDVRDVERDSMATLETALEESLERVERERPVETSLATEMDGPPRPMSDRCRTALRAAAETAGLAWTDLHSGAAHDSMHVARVTDAGMLFAPSRDGVSHSPREWTDWADCAAATRVLAHALADLATE
jgi:N-carbamoyl-L-amino-acid hydrolase